MTSLPLLLLFQIIDLPSENANSIIFNFPVNQFNNSSLFIDLNPMYNQVVEHTNVDMVTPIDARCKHNCLRLQDVCICLFLGGLFH